MVAAISPFGAFHIAVSVSAIGHFKGGYFLTQKLLLTEAALVEDRCAAMLGAGSAGSHSYSIVRRFKL